MGEPAIEPAATAIVDIDGRTTELRVLLASHQVVVGDGELIETVACGVAGGQPLVDGQLLTNLGWSFRPHVRRLPPLRFRSIIATWLRRAMSDDPGLVAEFADLDGAITGVYAERDGWTTVHTYPDGRGGGTVVTTRTHLAGGLS